MRKKQLICWIIFFQWLNVFHNTQTAYTGMNAYGSLHPPLQFESVYFTNSLFFLKYLFPYMLCDDKLIFLRSYIRFHGKTLLLPQKSLLNMFSGCCRWYISEL